MQREHDTELPFLDESSRGSPFFWAVSSSSDDTFGAAKGASRLVAALIAAFRMVVKGGLMPHARHGGSGTAAVAVAGSKFDGTGLENEQIGQIHVTLTGFGVGGWYGAVDWGRGDSGFTGWRDDAWANAGLAVALRGLSGLFFCGLENIVIFGEDFKKPACNTPASQHRIMWTCMR